MTETTCPPPHPNPKKPDFTPPPKSCDTHVHVFGPGDVFPYHPMRTYTPPDASAEMLFALQDHLGFERTVIVQATCHGPDNTATLAAIAQDPSRFRGVAMIDETYGPKEFEILHEGGIRGVRMSFARHLSGPPDFTRIREVAGIVGPLGWHLELYLESQDVVDNAAELGGLGVPIVIDHMARAKAEDGIDQPGFQLLLGFLKDADFWVKISCAERLSADGPPFHDVIPQAQALIAAAPDRILWGSDWPHPNIVKWMPDDGAMVDLIPLYAPDPADQQKILVDNPARLYGFDA